MESNTNFIERFTKRINDTKGNNTVLWSFTISYNNPKNFQDIDTILHAAYSRHFLRKIVGKKHVGLYKVLFPKMWVWADTPQDGDSMTGIHHHGIIAIPLKLIPNFKIWLKSGKCIDKIVDGNPRREWHIAPVKSNSGKSKADAVRNMVFSKIYDMEGCLKYSMKHYHWLEYTFGQGILSKELVEALPFAYAEFPREAGVGQNVYDT